MQEATKHCDFGLRGLDERIRVAFYGNQHLDTWIKPFQFL